MRWLSSLSFLIFLQVSAAAQSPASGDAAKQILAGAREEAAKRTPYIMEYEVMPYPGGDVPEGTGVCTDLVVRAFRHAGFDLQQLLHEDRVAHAKDYPTQIWERKKADRNIDHRRCQNLVVWFKKYTQSLTIGTDAESLKEWRGGDVVFYVNKGASHPWHVAVVSDKHAADGMPLVIDSYPPRTSETHRLDEWAPIHSHFRIDKTKLKLKADPPAAKSEQIRRDP